jgi:hypothetical protein
VKRMPIFVVAFMVFSTMWQVGSVGGRAESGISFPMAFTGDQPDDEALVALQSPTRTSEGLLQLLEDGVTPHQGPGDSTPDSFILQVPLISWEGGAFPSFPRSNANSLQVFNDGDSQTSWYAVSADKYLIQIETMDNTVLMGEAVPLHRTDGYELTLYEDPERHCQIVFTADGRVSGSGICPGPDMEVLEVTQTDSGYRMSLAVSHQELGFGDDFQEGDTFRQAIAFNDQDISGRQGFQTTWPHAIRFDQTDRYGAVQIVRFPEECIAYHTVVGGDTLRTISRMYYGTEDHWRLIFDTNRHIIEDPNLPFPGLFPGQVLCIPPLPGEDGLQGNPLCIAASELAFDDSFTPVNVDWMSGLALEVVKAPADSFNPRVNAALAIPLPPGEYRVWVHVLGKDVDHDAAYVALGDPNTTSTKYKDILRRIKTNERWGEALWVLPDRQQVFTLRSNIAILLLGTAETEMLIGEVLIMPRSVSGRPEGHCDNLRLR